jgi:hypothetical protein
MALDGFPLTDRSRLQFDQAPTARGVWECGQRLCGSPQAPLALYADGQRLERSKKR